MHTLTAILDVTDPELEMVAEVAFGVGLDQATFLGRCLARGLLIVTQEYRDARAGLPLGPLALPPAYDPSDDIPF